MATVPGLRDVAKRSDSVYVRVCPQLDYLLLRSRESRRLPTCLSGNNATVSCRIVTVEFVSRSVQKMNRKLDYQFVWITQPHILGTRNQQLLLVWLWWRSYSVTLRPTRLMVMTMSVRDSSCSPERPMMACWPTRRCVNMFT